MTRARIADAGPVKPCGPGRCLRFARGFTLLELLFTLTTAATLLAMAIPHFLEGLDGWRTFGAAHYVAARLHLTRMEAVRRSRNTAIRFVRSGNSYTYAVHTDGNRNGVLTRDIESGVDPRINAVERLPDQFPGVDFAAGDNVPAVDGMGEPPGSDPVRFGSSDMVVFTAIGTSTPGSLYIRGRRGAQYVVRVFGDTGKIRILRFHPGIRAWKSL